MADGFHNIENTPSFEKLKKLDAYLDKQLQEYEHQKLQVESKELRVRVKKWLIKLSGLLLLLILPFFVLIRTSVWLYGTYQLNGWIALTGGVTATILLILLYALVISYRIAKKQMVNKYLVRGITLLVLAYCCYGLLYLSGMNAKNQEVRSYYHALHPILRITLATTTLADQQLIITDMKRVPDDYLSMGLPVNEQSLHYVQESGYVHAVDIRTIGRAGWKNWLTKSIFRIAGLGVIRHTGTADHLHVYLPLN